MCVVEKIPSLYMLSNEVLPTEPSPMMIMLHLFDAMVAILADQEKF